MRYCSQEILERNPFHASLEAAKSVADRLRGLAGVTCDGARLVDATLVAGQQQRPRILINNYATPTERDEQKGFANLCKGLFSMFRNPVAHDPRISRAVTDDELLETLTVVSLLHRRLDEAKVLP